MKNKTIDLNDPKDAKKFLRGVRIKGNLIEWVDLADGKRLGIEDMTDKELVRYAKDVYFDYCGGVERKGGYIELETEGMDQ